MVTGPESTGKTNIASHLSEKLHCVWVPEYARHYVENLKRPYTYDDIEIIARKQLSDYFYFTRRNKYVIFDTWLIITRVWFEKVFDRYPLWLDEKIKLLKIDLFLLCAPDLEWIPDPVRENGGEMRNELFQRYEHEIKSLSVPYGIVKGKGQDRYRAAEEIVKKYL